MKKLLLYFLFLPALAFGQITNKQKFFMLANSSATSGLAIFNETSFASATDFPITGTGISRGTGKLDLTGNPSLFTSYTRYDASTSPHRYTGLENWKQRLRVKTPSSITSTSYGIGIGIQSANTYDPYTMTLRWSWDTGGPGALGSLYLYNKATVAGQIQSVGALTPTANTYYWMEVERIKNTVKVTIFSDAGTELFTETLAFNLSSGYVQAPNVGQFVVHQFGGTANEVTDWIVTTSETTGKDYCVIGDSNTYGLFATATNLRWAELAMAEANKTYSINAGIADRTADVILKLPEIIRLNPDKVLLSIGRNDVANSVALGTIETNIDTIIETLETAGIEVQLCGVIASNVDVSGVQAHYDTKTNAHVDFYTATKGGGTALNATYNSGDAIHINVAGHELLGNLVVPLISGAGSGYGTGYAISIAPDLFEDRVNVFRDESTYNFDIVTPENYFASWIIRESSTQTAVASGSGQAVSFNAEFNQEDESGFGSLPEGHKFYDIVVSVTKSGNTYSRHFRRAISVLPATFTEGEADVVWDLASSIAYKDGAYTDRPGYKIFVKGTYSGTGYLGMEQWRSSDAGNPIHILFADGTSITTTASYIWRVNFDCQNVILDATNNAANKGAFTGTMTDAGAQLMMIEPVDGSISTPSTAGQNITVAGFDLTGNAAASAIFNVQMGTGNATINYDNYRFSGLNLYNFDGRTSTDEGEYIGYFNDSIVGSYAKTGLENAVICFTTIEDTGGDGFQLGPMKNSEFHNNYCTDVGGRNDASHRNLLQVIGHEDTFIYRNHFDNKAGGTNNTFNIATGRGGRGVVNVFSNIFDNMNTSSHVNGFINIQQNAYVASVGLNIYNNTFLLHSENSFEVWDADGSVTTILNPLRIVDNAVFNDTDADEITYTNTPDQTYYTIDNLFSGTSTDFDFADYATGDYKPADLNSALFAARTSFTKTHPCANQDFDGYEFEDDIQGAFSGVPLQIEGATPDVTAPTLVSATIENATPTQIVMVFDEVVTGTNLGFTIGGTTSTTFASISGSGTTTITGTMADAAENGETITLSYNSGTGDIEDGAGNALASFTDEAVTNNVEAAGSVDLKVNIFTGTATGWEATGATAPSSTVTTDYGQMGTSGIGLRSTSDGGTYKWNTTGTGGTTTGANTGVFPDNVMLSYWYVSTTEIGRLELYNHTGTPLNVGTFEIKIHSGRAVAGPRTTRFRVNGGSWQDLNSANNTANVVTFTGVSDVAGVITIECQSTTPTDSAFGYLNGFTIISE